MAKSTKKDAPVSLETVLWNCRVALRGIGCTEKNRDAVLVSSVSTVFGTDLSVLISEYLMLFLTRSEFDRYARFNSWGSARETFRYEDMCDVEIPIPDISVQKAIADIFTAYNTRKQINERLKAQIKDLCPILVKGAVEDGERV